MTGVQTCALPICLNILYQADEDGIQTGYFREGDWNGVPLLQVFGLDRMDNQQNMFPDGVFDFIDNAANAHKEKRYEQSFHFFDIVYFTLGPAATKAFPASLLVNLTKFFTKRSARSRALSSPRLERAYKKDEQQSYSTKHTIHQ